MRRIDDKGRIYHPALAELAGWTPGTDCAVTIDGDFLHIRPATRPGPDLGRFDGARLRVPPARLQAIGVVHGEEVALFADAETATVTVAAGAHLTDAFWALGELEELRNQLSQTIAERDTAIAEAKQAQDRAAALVEILQTMNTHDLPTPLARLIP